MFNLNSVLSSLRSQSEKFKDAINANVPSSDQLSHYSAMFKESLIEKSSQLKHNVVETSSVLKYSMGDKLGPFFPKDSNLSTQYEHKKRLDALNYFKKSREIVENCERDRQRRNRKYESNDNRPSRRTRDEMKKLNKAIPELKWPMIPKGNSSLMNFDPKNSSHSEESETSEEDITQKFERVIGRESIRKTRSDREETRRRLALEYEDLIDKPSGRKRGQHSRLQSSMNLQICFMNETASDSESPNSDNEVKKEQPTSRPTSKGQPGNARERESNSSGASVPTEDFDVKQARLQTEARLALSQAKEMARLQMAQEKDQGSSSPITEMVRTSLLKVGIKLPRERRRVSRQLLTEMNIAQLQVIVNDLHTHIEGLNETLVSMLLERDDLHMEQDSMLVDIEDLTKYLADKDNSPHQVLPLIATSRMLLGKK